MCAHRFAPDGSHGVVQKACARLSSGMSLIGGFPVPAHGIALLESRAAWHRGPPWNTPCNRGEVAGEVPGDGERGLDYLSSSRALTRAFKCRGVGQKCSFSCHKRFCCLK